jgi:hypothetical protein
VAATRELLGARSSQPLLDRVSQTLRAAAVDPEARMLVQRGRLTEELRPIGFGALEGVSPKPSRGERDRRERQQRLNQLRAEARRLAAEAQTAERAADEAEHEARRLRDEARARRADADAAATALGEAESST